jgi:hypothetical protein
VTTLVAATNAIYAEWLTFQAGSAYSALVTLFGNEDSSGGIKPEDGEAAWFRVTYREAAGGRANLNGSGTGSRLYERLGFLAIQCFTPANTGQQAANEMAEAARAAFEDRRHPTNSDIIYLNASVRPQPQDGKWHAVLLEIEVEVTDRK